MASPTRCSESFDNARPAATFHSTTWTTRISGVRSIFDTRHIVVINWIYELPYKNTKGVSGAVLGGWQITGITQFQSGTPFTIGTNTDYAGIGTSSFQPWQVNGSTVVGDRSFSNSAADSNFWFRTKNTDGSRFFTAPANGTFANQTKNIYYGPGFQNWNLGLFKTFSITERHRITFRAEAFNWLNHPNWGGQSGSRPIQQFRRDRRASPTATRRPAPSARSPRRTAGGSCS